jgi:isopentenyl phosphate kinase
MGLVIVKLGGSVITKKEGYKKENKKMITFLSRIISKEYGKNDLIIIHGAGSFGHAPVLKYGINNGIKTAKHKIGFSDTHLSMSFLSNIIVNELVKSNVPAVSVYPLFFAEQDNKKVSKFDISNITTLLKNGYVPVLCGDMVLDKKLGGSVISGDVIISLLSKKLNAKKMIFISDVEGVYVNGKVFPRITGKNIERIRSHFGLSKKADVTGGMYGKIKAIMKSKVPAVITNPKNLKPALEGEKVGTLILLQ